MDDREFKVAGVNGWRFLDVTSSGPNLALDYRVLVDASWVKDVQFELVHENTAGSSAKPIKTESVSPAKTNIDPWVWRHTFTVRGGHGIVRIRATVGKTLLLEDEINLASLDPSATQTALQRDPPRLVLDINDTPRSFPMPQATSEADKVAALLERIRHNLGRPLSDTAWLGPRTGRGLHLNETPLNAEQARDEGWARRVSEMLLVVPYMMPGTIYGCSDARMYDRIAARLAAGQEGFFPVVAQCQHLATMLILTRGVPRNLLGSGLNSGNSESLDVFKPANQGAWHKGDAIRNAQPALTATPPVGCASVYEFAIPGHPNAGQAHIGTVIRTHAGSWYALQSFDTGGLNAKGRNTGVRLTAVGSNALGSGTFDDPWVQRIEGTKEPSSGVGVIGPQHTVPANLEQWWPCGFCRLMVRRRSDQTLLYATPLMRMHDSSIVYPLSALANSLRGVPFLDELSPIWQMSAPRGDCTTVAMTQPRGTTVAQVFASTNVPPTRPLSDNSNHLYLLSNIETSTDGVVRRVSAPSHVITVIVQGKPVQMTVTYPDALPWGVVGGSLASNIATALPIS